MTLNQKLELSRELRQWVGIGWSLFIGGIYLDYLFNDGKAILKPIVNKIDNSINNHTIKTNLAKEEKKNHIKAKEIEKAKKNGYKVKQYSTEKWNQIKQNFRLIKNTVDNDGYYMLVDETYYVTLQDWH